MGALCNIYPSVEKLVVLRRERLWRTREGGGRAAEREGEREREV